MTLELWLLIVGVVGLCLTAGLLTLSIKGMTKHNSADLWIGLGLGAAVVGLFSIACLFVAFMNFCTSLPSVRNFPPL